MKAVMISIQPKWCELIASGKKTIEVRKTAPKLATPFKCYIYATQPKKWFRFSSIGYASDESLWISDGKVKMCAGFEYWGQGKDYWCLNGKVIGEFTCRGMMDGSSPLLPKQSCLTPSEIFDYSKGKHIYGWRIADLVIYDKPKELSEFFPIKPKRVEKWRNKDDCAFCKYHRWGKNFTETCLLDKPEPICEYTPPLERPPQSWCYVEEANNE